MKQRTPNPHSPEEVRRAFGKVQFDVAVLSEGAAGEILVGAGVGTPPTWTTSLTTLTLLTVDNITINGATIVSDTGTVGFGDDNLSTTGSITGVNVTSGADPGHTHSIYALVVGEAEANEDIIAGLPVYGLSGQSKVGLSRADSPAKNRVAGLSRTTTPAGNTDTFVSAGHFELADWTAITGSAALTPNSVYYLGETGGLTTTAPTTAGQYVVEVGRAFETTILDLCIKRPILL
jgi:hypothetical protein